MCLGKCTFYSSSLLFHRFSLSHDMIKPTMWVCAQRRLRSAWASAQSDQSSLTAWRKHGSLATHWAHSEDSDQTGQMPRLIWVFTLRTLILLVLSCCGSFMKVGLVFVDSTYIDHLYKSLTWQRQTPESMRVKLRTIMASSGEIQR